MEFLLNSTARDLLCNVNSCLSWIFVIVNFMTISYLAFCNYYKLNKPVKVIGFVWSGLVVAGAGVLVALHTCIFTIMCTVFTAMLVYAVLYVLLKDNETTIKAEKQKKASESSTKTSKKK